MRTVWILGAGVVGLSIAGCFSDSVAPSGVDSGPSLPDATADDGGAVIDATADVTVDSGALGDDADAIVAPDVTADAAAPIDASDAAAVTDASDAGVPCDAPSTGTHMLLTFDPTDPEYVSGVSWVDSTGATTANWSAAGGPAHCSDPQEFFGQAYGAPEGTSPLPVVGGHLATLASGSTCDSTVKTLTAGPVDCTGAAQLPVTTAYAFYGGARADEVKITRTFGFDGTDAATPVYSGTTGLRPYVPRVVLSVFPTVIYPNQAGTAVTSVAASSCGGDCFTVQDSGWSGRWFADVATSGYAIIILRDPSMTSPVDLTVNWDSYSSSNLASFVLLQPTAGWQSPVTEIEYMCFADLTTWPQTQRDAAVLPAGCGL